MFHRPYADIACNFFEKVLRHTADEWYGMPFLLAPWQEDCLSHVFGDVDDDGNRITDMVYLEVPKKSGKSEFAAGMILLVMIIDRMKGSQIYGAAAATRQALNVYRAAVKMVEQEPLLLQQLRILRGTNRILKYTDPDSFYAAIAADGDLGDGVNPAFTVADELHRWRTRKQIENWDVLSNGGITRRQTLTVAITTAGVQNESPLAWRMHEKTRKIQAGVVHDEKFYGRIYGADKGDDPSKESTWIKAAPSLKQNGGFLDIEKYRQKYRTHLAEGDLTSFKRYFLNMWDQRESLAIDMNKWDASAGEWKAEGIIVDAAPIIIKGQTLERSVKPFRTEFLQRFIERKCWAGVDISMTTDFTSAVFVFPYEGIEEEIYDVLPFFWFPESNVRKYERVLGIPLRQLADDGFLELVPGEVIDYRDVRARLDWAAKMFSLQEICWDPWNSRQISVNMVEDGYRCFDIRQGYQTLSEPTKKILELVAKGNLHHGGHPLLRHNAACAATSTDGRDNLIFTKPDRFKTTSRIDGIAAMTNAMTRAMLHKSGPKFQLLFMGGPRDENK